MSIGNPHALYLLLLIPVIILLHSVRTRRKEIHVSSLILWEKALSEYNRTFRFKRIVRSLALLLQIITAALIILALTDPAITRSGSPFGGDVIIVLDASASMKTRDSWQSRFEKAREIAFTVLDGMDKDGEAMIIRAGRRAVLLTPFTSDKSLLKRIVRDAEPADEEGRIEEAIIMAMSFGDREKNRKVILISDGAFDLSGSIDLEKSDVDFFSVGARATNLGITKFRFRRLFHEPGNYELMVGIQNYNEAGISTALRLLVDDVSIFSQQVQVAGRTEQMLIFPYSGLIAGKAVVELDVEDDFPIDNRAYAVLSPKREIRVLLYSTGNYFLENVLSAYPGVSLDADAPDPDFGAYDIVIYDGVPPRGAISGNVLLINTSAPNVPLQIEGTAYNPVVTSWNRDHPVLDSLSLKGLTIAESLHATGGQGTDELILAAGLPLALAYEEGFLRVVFIGFDLLKSDLPVRVAFPVLIGNILKWLFPGNLTDPSAQVSAGETYSIFIPERQGGKDLAEIIIKRPDGKTETLPASQNPQPFENTSAVGFYTVTGDGFQRRFAVNLLSGSESDISPRSHSVAADAGSSEVETVPGGEAETSTGDRIKMPVWQYAAMCALLVILAEWYIWLRRW